MGRSIKQCLSFPTSQHAPSPTQAIATRSRVNSRNRVRQGILLVLSVVLISISVGHTTLLAATITAASCSRADVGTAVNAAANGDTVLIPAGTCTWTTNLTISNKYLTLQGAGISQTVIIDNVVKSGFPIVPQALVWSTIDGGLTRLTGITWQGGTTVDAGPNKGMVVFQGQSKQLRVDNCKFVPTRTTALFFYFGQMGVVDHNVFDLSANSGYGFYNMPFDWTVPGSNYGDYSWTNDDTLGTNQAMFFEDNLFTNDQSIGLLYFAIDGWGGSRIVLRHNTFQAATVGSHGTESPGRWRGQRQFEIYNNTLTWNMQGNYFESWFDTRSGVGVIFNNTATITNPTNGLSTVAVLKVFRTFGSYAPWGKCDGTSPWDGNTSPPGYPCLDQVGWASGDLVRQDPPINTVRGSASWPRQTLKPVYIWNNTINGVASNARSAQPTYITENREFYNGTPKPGYVPYTYPHPLVTTSGSTNPPPSPPQNLTVR